MSLVTLRNDAISRVANQVTEWAPIRFVTSTAASVASFLILRPMVNLYLRGPTMLGFWGGADLHDICQQLTGSPSRHFISDNGTVVPQCIELIETRFYSWVILSQTIIYVYVLISLFRYVMKLARHRKLTFRRSSTEQYVRKRRGKCPRARRRRASVTADGSVTVIDSVTVLGSTTGSDLADLSDSVGTCGGDDAATRSVMWNRDQLDWNQD
jgi:hypothetical protein